jgi:hypothetical protein
MKSPDLGGMRPMQTILHVPIRRPNATMDRKGDMDYEHNPF